MNQSYTETHLLKRRWGCFTRDSVTLKHTSADLLLPTPSFRTPPCGDGGSSGGWKSIIWSPLQRDGAGPTHHLYPVWEGCLLKPICSRLPVASSETLMRQEPGNQRPLFFLYDWGLRISNQHPPEKKKKKFRKGWNAVFKNKKVSVPKKGR